MNQEVTPACVMIIFGASGDLTRRKLMPALYGLESDGLLNDDFVIVGLARQEKDDAGFRAEMEEAIGGARAFEQDVWDRFAARLHYVTGQYGDEASFARLAEKIEEVSVGQSNCRRLYYLAVPPSVVSDILGRLAEAPGMLEGCEQGWPKLMIEKPFGHNLTSAIELNRLLGEMFDESRVYRIDHYLAKETVRNLLVLRFTNGIFEPLWNQQYIDNIQITAAEEIGVQARGGYYEQSGVVRDMIQNHVLQVMALVAMEPPLAGDSESVRDRKVEVFKSLETVGEGDFVFGQYEGYRNEVGVESDSNTPTFACVRFHINNLRWKGVPFYLRSGKKLARKVTEVAVQFKNVPVCMLEDQDACDNVQPNVLTIRIQPEEGIRLRLNTEAPGRKDEVGVANLDFRYGDSGVELEDAYERVLLDCLRGRPTLFWRADGTEAAWQAVAPMLAAQEELGAIHFYKPGSWGPKEADSIIHSDSRSWLKSY